MTKDRIRELLEAYGADPARWPAADRGMACLVESDVDARRLAAEAQRLDVLIGRHATAALPMIDATALVERVTATPQPRGYAIHRVAADAIMAGWRLSFGWPKIAGHASVALIGFVVGFTDLDGSIAQADDEEAVAGIFGVFEDSPW